MQRKVNTLQIFIAILLVPCRHSFVNLRQGLRPKLIIYSNENSQVDESEPPKLLSNQDLILQEVFGIEPETESQRQERLSWRQDEFQQRKNQRWSNIGVAMFSFLIAVGSYVNQYTHPTTSLSLLAEMQRNSDSLQVIGRNGKPTVVEFWAPWCENCKASAPTLYSIESEYRGRINFVHVNANENDQTTWLVIDRFGVDAIPHLALVDSEGDVETALIGPIPRSVLRKDLDVMIENSQKELSYGGYTGTTTSSVISGRKALPYTMYDAFEKKNENRRVRFQ